MPYCPLNKLAFLLILAFLIQKEFPQHAGMNKPANSDIYQTGPFYPLLIFLHLIIQLLLLFTPLFQKNKRINTL